MFRKLHIKLTFLFTAVCVMIVLVMSGFYLYMNYHSIYNNAFAVFSNDNSAFCTSFSEKRIVSHDWLINYSYSFYIYDNGKPLQYTLNHTDEHELELIEYAKEKNSYDIQLVKNSPITRSSTYICEHGGEKYFMGIIRIPFENGSTEIYTLDILNREKEQVKELYLLFAVIILLSSAVLYLFAYFFTKRLLKPVKTAHEQQSHFIAAASHEIRNPVNTIMSALEAMDKSDGEKRREFANIARKEGKRLTLLTEDLLTLARSENGSLVTDKMPVELDTLILDCYEAFIAPAQEKSITLNIILPEESVPKTEVNSERIKQVIAILLNNAISYTPPNGKVDICYLLDSQWHIISVKDSGNGISDDDLAHIFEYFYRADCARENNSHFGLGLAIAKEITELHHGKIIAENAEGGGAVFTFKLPL